MHNVNIIVANWITKNDYDHDWWYNIKYNWVVFIITLVVNERPRVFNCQFTVKTIFTLSLCLTIALFHSIINIVFFLLNCEIFCPLFTCKLCSFVSSVLVKALEFHFILNHNAHHEYKYIMITIDVFTALYMKKTFTILVI